MSVEKEIERFVVLLNNIVSSKIENENMALNKNYLEQFVALFPERKAEIERFDYLQAVDNKPRVAVFGKFNHGKSTLLNALIDHEGYFKASDKRETRTNADFKDEKNGIIWLDTPGLDADVTGKDDFEANKGAFVSADIVLMIHTLKAGELDKYEVEHISRLLDASKNDNKLLVLTQIDQITEDQQKVAVKRIKEQLPKFEPILVSATRYLKGVTESKAKLVELSGVPELKNRIQGLKSTVAEQRNKEVNELRKLLDNLLDEKASSINKKLSTLNKAQKDKRNNFEHQLNKIFNSL